MRNLHGQSKGPDGGRTKYVEMAGTPISMLFNRKENKGCSFRTKCYMEEGQDCTVTKAVYRIECKTCSSRGENPYVYIGTTGFSIHKRNLEHAAKVRAKNTSNALAKHLVDRHLDEEVEFTTTCLSGGMKFNLNRFILEAIEIEDAKCDPKINILNSRSEWGGKGLPRLVVHQ